MDCAMEEGKEEERERESSNMGTNKGYLIALVQDMNAIKVYGSPTDRNDCDEILEINGRSLGTGDSEQQTTEAAEPDQIQQCHADIVQHIHECIKLKNICLRVKRAPKQLNNGKDSTLLDVFVIGANAHEQLNRFFRITNILADPKDLLKLTNKMELAEFNTANQTTVNNNSTFNVVNQHHQEVINSNTQSQAQQHPNNNGQMNLSPAHLFRNHHHHQQQQQQQQQQQPNLRYVTNNNPKVSKHRELPVDVPDSFVGIAKQSPRYPPPKPHRQISPSMPTNFLTAFDHAPSTMPYNTNSCTQQPAIPQVSPATAANIVTHNSSLRSSIKLKQLEKSRNGQHGHPLGQMQPAINQAFELNEDDITSTNYPSQTKSHNHQATNAKQALKMKQTIPDLCSIYSRLERNLNGEFTDISGDAKLAKLLSIYNTIVQTHNTQFRIPSLTSRHVTTNDQHNPEPITYKVSELRDSVISLLSNIDEMSEDDVELMNILCKHEVDGVCSAFDRIAQSFEFVKASGPEFHQSIETAPENDTPHHETMYTYNQDMHQIPNHEVDDYEYNNDQVRSGLASNHYPSSMHPLTDIDLSDNAYTTTVSIEKTTNHPFGATIKNDVDGSVVIGRVLLGGAAHKSGRIHEGDEILDINGVQLRGKNINEVINILEQMNGILTFTIVTRNYNKPIQRNPQEKIVVKAFFDYDAKNDSFMPCKELGLSFEKGEILTIIDQSDPQWWQAQREPDSDYSLAGLIPSVNYLKQRENHSNNEDIATAHFKHEKKTLVSILFNCPKGSSPRRRKKSLNMPFSPDEIPYYEEVLPFYPKGKYRKRPIILVGPRMIGQREIVSKLLKDSNNFAQAVSHTSKPMESHERNGVDFHFVSKAQFEADIKAGKFIEYGQYQNQYYGTSIEAMREVIKSRKTCIQTLNIPSILNFRQGPAGVELKPFFVFVKPDDSHPEKVKNIVSTYSPPKSNIEENIESIMKEVYHIEAHFSPYFDLVLTVSDVERAYQDLLKEIERIEKEPQWIPSFWRDSPKPSN